MTHAITDKVKCYIGLGSNLDNPKAHVLLALQELQAIPDSRLGKLSSLYRSDPVGPEGQPDYINAVAELFTALDAETLLDHLQSIENSHQRVRQIKWGPRTLDLDLILYGNEVINTARLQVPHPFAQERNFVLWPLAEIDSMLTFPDNRSINDLLVACPVGTLEKISV